MKPRLGVFAASLAVALALVACSGGDPCAGSPCPNDAHPTPAQYDQCVKSNDANKNSKCNSVSIAAELCNRNNTVCKADGTTDSSLTLTKTSNNCKQANDAS